MEDIADDLCWLSLITTRSSISQGPYNGLSTNGYGTLVETAEQQQQRASEKSSESSGITLLLTGARAEDGRTMAPEQPGT